MVKKRKKKNAITLLALVITIVIMLLLAGVAIQMTMGENGLIAKSVQAQKEQAKAELYDTAKLSYTSLNAKALENGQPSPQAELALSTTEFTNKYNVVGDDITDKKGTVIDTKLNVLNIIQGTVAGGFSSGTTSGTTTPAVYKTVGGVQILEDDKDKMILKLKILRENSEIRIVMPVGVGSNDDDPETAVNIDFGNGIKREVTNLYSGESMEYAPGEYIVKIDRIRTISIQNHPESEVEILQWGKIRIDTTNSYGNVLEISNVFKIYEPEPDKIVVMYINALFKEIPEWLFSKKVINEVMSKFVSPYSKGSSKIEKIPEDLFKNCVNAKDFSRIFVGCKKLKEIPENLFKYNVNATNFEWVFYNCTGLTSIPEGLFENNVNVTNIKGAFMDCTGITSIPEKIIEFAKQVKNNGGRVYGIFAGCISASNYNSMPDYMIEYP